MALGAAWRNVSDRAALQHTNTDTTASFEWNACSGTSGVDAANLFRFEWPNFSSSEGITLKVN